MSETGAVPLRYDEFLESILDRIEHLLENDVSGGFASLPNRVQQPNPAALDNVNTPDDLESSVLEAAS